MSGARDHVLRALIAEVVEARLRPGDALSGAPDLASRFGVSEDVARGAVCDLVGRGLAFVADDGSARVHGEARWDVLDPVVLDVMLASRHGAAILVEYLETRRILEITAAGLAAERATADDLNALSGALAGMASATEHAPVSAWAEEQFHRADVEFHQALIAAAHNRPLELAADPLQAALCTARRPLARPGLRRDRGLPQHQRILAAVAQGDAAGARRAMAEHLDTVESYLREYADSARDSETCAQPDDR